MNLRPFDLTALELPARGDDFPVIEVVPGQIITRSRVEKVKIRDGAVQPDVSRDILKLVVMERHRATGNTGRGLVKGFGLKHGALASSVAHDSHNIIAVGTADAEIAAAIHALESMQGGLAAVSHGKVIARLALPIAGLLSAEPLEETVLALEKLEQCAKDLGSTLPAAFAALSFLALPVIPEIRLTTRGLLDVRRGEFLA